MTPPIEPDAFDPEFLTIRDVMARAQVSDATVRRAIRQRRLRAIQLTARGRWRIRYTDFQAWMSGIDPRVGR